jgi:hypothetical protein
MGRKSVSQIVRVAVAATLWAGAALIVQTTAGADIEGAAERLEQRLELQLKERRVRTPEPRPLERTHEDPIEPWELVSV